jgi:hypothetical protein
MLISFISIEKSAMVELGVHRIMQWVAEHSCLPRLSVIKYRRVECVLYNVYVYDSY